MGGPDFVADPIANGSANRAFRVLVLLSSPFLYGQERTVIETFALLRPDVEPHFLMAYTARRRNLLIFRTVQERGLRYSFFSDWWGWPTPGKPRSLTHFLHMMVALLIGNIDVVRAARGTDALYLSNLFALMYAATCCVLFRLMGRRVIYEFHDLRPGQALVFRLLGPLVTDFVNLAAFGDAHTQRYYGFIPAHKLVVIPPPIDAPPPAGAIQPMGLRAEERSITYAGRISPDKGVDLLVRAFVLLAAEFPDIRLDLVGGLEGSEYERSLRRIVAEGGVTDRVHFHGYRNDSANFLAQAYVCIQPSLPVLEESFGRTVAEAMAAGVPAVVFRSGALQETVIHEETGLICNETTPECLAAALRRLLLDSSLRHRYGAAGRCRYEQLYSPEPVRALWLALLRGDTGAQRRRGHERPAP